MSAKSAIKASKHALLEYEHLEQNDFDKTTPKRIGTLIRSMKFLSPEVALYLYKSTFVMSDLVLLVATWNSWINTETNMQDCWSFTYCLS